MPEGIKIVDNFRRIYQAISGLGNKLSEEAMQAGRDYSLRLTSEIRKRQPDGSKTLDPIAAAANRSPRPSIRQGNTPIMAGWVGPTVTKQGNKVVIRLASKSSHVIYYTQYPNRPYLGTQGSWNITARRRQALVFWWREKTRYVPRPLSVTRKGAVPKSDFLNDAYAAAQGWLKETFPPKIVSVLRDSFMGIE